MFLLTAKLVKNSHIYARIFFIFLKNVLKQIWTFFSQIQASVKRSKKQLPSKLNFRIA